MALIHARPFIRSVVEDVTSLEEHRDAFSISNIPNTLLDSTYHIGPGGFPLDQRYQQPASSVFYRTELTIFKRGFQDTSGAVDEIIAIAEPIIQALLDPQRRTVNVKQVLYNDLRILDFEIDSDHIVLAQIDLDLMVILCANNV